MLDLVRPRGFLPVHGTIHHLTRHAALAREAGVENVAVIENGRVAEVSGAGAIALGDTLPSGRIFVWAGREVPPLVLRDRTILAAEGVIVALVTVDGSADAGSLDELRKVAVRAAVDSDPAKHDDAAIAEQIRLALRRWCRERLGHKPVTIAHFVRGGAA